MTMFIFFEINFEYNRQRYIAVKTSIYKLLIMLSLNIIKEPIDQSWSIQRITTERPPRTWEHVFEDAKYELRDVSSILDEQEKSFGSYYPLKKDIFAAFNYTPLSNVKVVILGQDPYHQSIPLNGVSAPRAIGFSFSVRQEDSIPSSLNNIYTELSNTIRGFVKSDHGDLREWAKQGVLLLNTCLTVRPNQAGSHGDIWLGFINKVFKAISIVNPYCIYMLWGREAQKVRSMIGDRSIVLEAAHPSGFSARRGFFGCNHFNLANEALIKQGKTCINWKISTISELNSSSSHSCFNTSVSQSYRYFAPVNIDALPVNVPPSVSANSSSNATSQSSDHNNYHPIAFHQNIIPVLHHVHSSEYENKIANSSQTSPKQQTKTESTPVPIIPKIQFGDNFNIKPPINIPNAIQSIPSQNTRVPLILASNLTENQPVVSNLLPIIQPII